MIRPLAGSCIGAKTLSSGRLEDVSTNLLSTEPSQAVIAGADSDPGAKLASLYALNARLPSVVQTVRPITERPGFECFRIAVNWSLANSDNSLPRARSCKCGSTKLSRERAVVAAACSTTPRSMRPPTHHPRTDIARPTTAVAMMAKRFARSRESQNEVATRIVAAGTLRVGGETE